MEMGGRGPGPARRRGPGWLRSTVTVVAFMESGRMRRWRISGRLLAGTAVLLGILLLGAGTSLIGLFRGHVDLARMGYLERENRSLATLLEGQAEQLSRLKLEVARLKEFERNLRVVSGLDAEATPMVGTGQGRGAREELPRKR